VPELAQPGGTAKGVSEVPVAQYRVFAVPLGCSRFEAPVRDEVAGVGRSQAAADDERRPSSIGGARHESKAEAAQRQPTRTTHEILRTGMRRAGSLAFLASTDVSQWTEWEGNRSEGQRPSRDDSGDPPARGAPLPAPALTQVAHRRRKVGAKAGEPCRTATLPASAGRRQCVGCEPPRNRVAVNGNGRSHSPLAARTATSSSPVTQKDLRGRFASQLLTARVRVAAARARRRESDGAALCAVVQPAVLVVVTW
jgi:hypothetical protein